MLLHLDPSDNVAIASAGLEPGQKFHIVGTTVTVKQAIPAGHKIALRAIAPGAEVIRYGAPIGVATASIAPGEWVHEHNLRSALAGPGDLSYQPGPQRPLSAPQNLTWEGFQREDGRAGARNEVWIIPTVGCVNSVAVTLAEWARKRGLPEGVDAVRALTHVRGCSQTGQDLARTREVLAGLTAHPNAGGVLVLGLGCENNTLDSVRTAVRQRGALERVRFLAAQEVEDELSAAQALLERLLETAAAARRVQLPSRKLCVGLKCGASDAFSGITANPVLGLACDRLLAEGAIAVMGEVPEMFGAERALAARCASRPVFEKFALMVYRMRQYYLRHGVPLWANPSPGNRAAGITTLEEKALGAIRKGGCGPIVDAVDYGGQVHKSGLNILECPGNDAVSVTALAAAGAQLILFTTGLGTPLASPVPTLKISSTSSLAERKRHWIDFDAGPAISGTDPDMLAEQLVSKALDVASGRARTRDEDCEPHRQIAIWQDGVTF